MINLDFDYVKYLNALKAYGMNYTRPWPGAVIEMVGEYVQVTPRVRDRQDHLTLGAK